MITFFGLKYAVSYKLIRQQLSSNNKSMQKRDTRKILWPIKNLRK